ncbi:IPT/TIG domain-containing protein [Engelhardtia mirabilis]|uniref:IPT/TIG domain-containing protein n=1 Tax=Engelhardtia mirabilis TaxID=2528011 RepID=A0A518BKH4_9BACT|nr:hypothetical protein Pla133_25510 [Planctomycetes bacterium Pla133]QDV01794.1 hypothetical protein Pla86_25500 [Planctomycetes bacterium Pla86]
MIGSRLGWAALAVASAPLAQAQLASSAGFRLETLALDGGGAGTCSIGFAAILDQPALEPSSGLASPGFGAQLGSLTLTDPLATDQPAVFAVEPPFGPKSGGTVVTLCGIHLDRGGLAAPVVASLDGSPLAGLVVLSDSTVTATVPAGANGPADLLLSTSLGTASLGGGFVHTPAVTSSPVAYRTGEIELANYGAPGGFFDMYASPFVTNLPLPPYGNLLIGPAPLIPLIFIQPYPAPDGIVVTRATIPDDPGLSGLFLHFQSIAVQSLAPLDVQLVNRASTLLQ